jgi:N-acetyl-gamma-glutamyl-phosphate reductase
MTERTEPIDVAILGATGYGGQELLRLLAAHPRFRPAYVTSRRHAGKAVEDVIAQLSGFYPGLKFSASDEELPDNIQAAFAALPHGITSGLFELLPQSHPSLKIVDLSADFRLRDRADYDSYYGKPHPTFGLTERFVYGLTETNRIEISRARWVANPGCFATGAILALAPLAEAGLLAGDVVLSQTTGSSGSGAEPRPTTHHPERAQDHKAYRVLWHQHHPEIEQELRRCSGVAGGDFDMVMIPQSGAFARGIFTVAHLRIAADANLEEFYRSRYLNDRFVRIRTESPALRHVTRTNFCDLSVHQRGDRVVVLTAIDNLVKGMSGQAIQNLNLMFGLPEETGLMQPGANA